MAWYSGIFVLLDIRLHSFDHNAAESTHITIIRWQERGVRTIHTNATATRQTRLQLHARSGKRTTGIIEKWNGIDEQPPSTRSIERHTHKNEQKIERENIIIVHAK